MAPKLFEKMYDYFLAKGNKWMTVITIIEVVFYIGYTVIYSVEQVDYTKKFTTDSATISSDQYYRWALTLVLLLSLLYFLWHSVSYQIFAAFQLTFNICFRWWIKRLWNLSHS
jgi:hypothetical protein